MSGQPGHAPFANLQPMAEPPQVPPKMGYGGGGGHPGSKRGGALGPLGHPWVGPRVPWGPLKWEGGGTRTLGPALRPPRGGHGHPGDPPKAHQDPQFTPISPPPSPLGPPVYASPPHKTQWDPQFTPVPPIKPSGIPSSPQSPQQSPLGTPIPPPLKPIRTPSSPQFRHPQSP